MSLYLLLTDQKKCLKCKYLISHIIHLNFTYPLHSSHLLAHWPSQVHEAPATCKGLWECNIALLRCGNWWTQWDSSIWPVNMVFYCFFFSFFFSFSFSLSFGYQSILKCFEFEYLELGMPILACSEVRNTKLLCIYVYMYLCIICLAPEGIWALDSLNEWVITVSLQFTKSYYIPYFILSFIIPILGMRKLKLKKWFLQGYSASKSWISENFFWFPVPWFLLALYQKALTHGSMSHEGMEVRPLNDRRDAFW